jgi:hypothetical protein
MRCACVEAPRRAVALIGVRGAARDGAVLVELRGSLRALVPLASGSKE